MPEASRRTIALDPDAGTLPEGLLLPPEQGGEVVAFVVDPRLREWAPSAVFSLARGWSHRGRACLVVDADFGGPSLPPGSGVTSREGLSDALFYGASVERVTMDLPSQPFDLIPAGTVVPDAAQAWVHGAWTHLLAQFRSEDRVVLLLVPGNREGVTPLLARADRVFRLGLDPAEGLEAYPLIHPASHSLAADPALTPESAVAPKAEPQPFGNVEEPRRSARPVDGLTRADQTSLAEKRTPVTRPLAPSSMTEGETGPGTAGASPRRRSLASLLLVLLLLLLILVGALWLGWLEIPGLDLPGRTALAE